MGSDSHNDCADRQEGLTSVTEAPPGPRRIATLRSRQSPLADPLAQLRTLRDLSLSRSSGEPTDFEIELTHHGWQGLLPEELEIFQINLGRLCNMSCRHCHVDAGPDRTSEVMDRQTVEACLRALDRTSARTVDITGGAPEMNPNFRFLVNEATRRGKHVIDRCNLTILLVPQFGDLPDWLGERGVEIVASLPHFRPRNTDAQRGKGAFEQSIEALHRLNAAGYGQGDPFRRLVVMTNPAGAYLAADQEAMEAEWRVALERDHGVTLDGLIALNNMPCARFLEWLVETSNLSRYMELLISAFNSKTIANLMCRNTISVSWDGRIFDCDFNQMLELEISLPDGLPMHIGDFDPDRFAGRQIRTAPHCFGCTAGAGSSCGGATAD